MLLLLCLLPALPRVDRRAFLKQGVLPSTALSALSLTCPPREAVATTTSYTCTSADACASAYTWETVPGPSPNDRRDYGYITLENGVRGLVCCDESYSRCELAVTVPCGSLDDPANREGLAHLTEHMTLATDAAGLASFIDEREGDLNAFTGERTTSFYGQYDLLKKVRQAPSASTAVSGVAAAAKDDIKQGCRKFAALFDRPTILNSNASAIVAQEVNRVDAELTDIIARPSRGLIEIAALKARAAPESAWRRLGRGGKTTLRAETRLQAQALGEEVDALRRARCLLAPDGF